RAGLFPDKAGPRQIAFQLIHGVWWNSNALGRAHLLEPVRRIPLVSAELPDAQTHQGALHATDDPCLFTAQLLVLAIWPLPVLLFDGMTYRDLMLTERRDGPQVALCAKRPSIPHCASHTAPGVDEKFGAGAKPSPSRH